ncbi:MAG: hypothetical protein ABFD54_08285 [Armatimonadota bacterium]
MIYKRLSVLTLLFCGIVCASFTGCEYPGATRRAIRNDLSGNAVSVHDQVLLRKLGEDSIPVVYDEIQRSPSDLRVYQGDNLLIGIVVGGKADPSAPYIRSILDDGRQPRDLRLVSADVLGWYPGSHAVWNALIAHAKHDADITVRARCINSFGLWYCGSLARHRISPTDFTTQRELAGLLHDESATIRKSAYEAIVIVGLERLREGVDTATWAESILRVGLKDKSKPVRKAALEGLAAIHQEKRHIRAGSKAN